MDQNVAIALCSFVGSLIGSYVTIKIQLAVTEQIAKDARSSAESAHRRLDDHLGRLHHDS